MADIAKVRISHLNVADFNNKIERNNGFSSNLKHIRRTVL